jgi:hypothetical protein
MTNRAMVGPQFDPIYQFIMAAAGRVRLAVGEQALMERVCRLGETF